MKVLKYSNAVGVCHNLNLNLMLRNAASFTTLFKYLVELHLKASYLYIGSAAQLRVERLYAANTWQGGVVSNPDTPSTRNS